MVYSGNNCCVMKPITRLTAASLSLFVVYTSLTCCNRPVTYPDGGYNYPDHYNEKDTAFYYCPLRPFFSRKDSFNMATNFFFYSFFKEPNYSIKPYAQDVFRLVYSPGMGYSTFITLKENEITIKELDYASDTIFDNKSLLTKKEHYLDYVLQRHFPLDSAEYNSMPSVRKRLDSLLRIYPQLRDVNYYWALECKSRGPVKWHKLNVAKVKITPEVFKHIVSVINKSGYWKMPWKIKCEEFPTDAGGFSLEANTARKYNFVQLTTCDDNTPMQIAFEKACQEIVHYARLDNRIQLVWDGRIEVTPTDSLR